MKTLNLSFSRRLLLGCLCALAVLTARADVEQDQFAILRSDASVAKKWTACQKLRVIGTVKAVPEVALLLTNSDLSQAARQTLEGLPYPEADAALEDALGKTSGLVKAGIIDSIGWRGKPAVVPLLMPLLADSDTNIAAAAATSLGRIGGDPAIAALSAAKDAGPPAVQFAVDAALLQCAERQAEHNDSTGAIAIYRGLFYDKYPVGIRTAAWRGLFLSDAAEQTGLMKKALSGSDPALRKVALKVMREANVTLDELSQWAAISPEAQIAAIDAAVKHGDEALPIIHAAGQSSNDGVRAAAWIAVGELNDLTSIPALAHAAATGQKAERQAASASLARLHGPQAADGLIAALDQAAAQEKIQLLRALADRREPKLAGILLQNAAAGDESVREAALQSLEEMAPPEALSPLLDIVTKAGSGDLRDHAIETLQAVCRATPDKEAATRAVVAALNQLPAEAQVSLLPVMSALGTAEALAAVQSAGASQNIELARESVRVLGAWPNAAPADSLLQLARTTKDATMRTLALRGAISVSAGASSVSNRLEILTQAYAMADRPDEKKQALAQLADAPAPAALELALKAMDDDALSDEASLAAISIAEKLPDPNSKLVQDAVRDVLQRETSGDVFQRAWKLRAKGHLTAPFIREWMVCGPYAKKGVTGAIAVFKIPFGPETARQAVKWKPAPEQDHVALAEIFSGKENCAAYLRTTVISPSDCSAALLMGSDDGVKAWLNGKIIHSHNIDRPEVPDEDIAPIKLKKGPNDLLLKISQGGGGWSACARITGADGNTIAGLRFERPAATEPDRVAAK